jgi:hypothetical protein
MDRVTAWPAARSSVILPVMAAAGIAAIRDEWNWRREILGFGIKAPFAVSASSR